MEHTHHPSHRLLLIGLAAVVALIGAVALVALLLVGPGKHEATSLVPTKSNTRQLATKDEISKDIDDLNASLKQFSSDHEATNAVLKDKQVKVSS